MKQSILFLIGGFIYYIIEILARGYSHWSMFILGGICFVLMGAINEYFNWDTPLWKQCVISMMIITVLEFIFGCILNLWLGLHIWDYSHRPLNLLGQICVPYMAIWFCLSGIGIYLDDMIRWKWFGEEKPRYRIF